MPDNEQIFPLPSQEVIDNAKREFDIKVKTHNLDDSQIKNFRIQAKHNLYFLCHGLLGYNKLSKTLHVEFIKWLKETMYWQFRLILLPRSHYKTTVKTKGGAIQLALPDDLKTLKYPYDLGSNIRCLICHEVAGSAEAFLSEIQNHFLANAWIVGLFPELVPDLKKHKVNKQQLELPRNASWSEPTFDTMGVGGRKQGAHYNYIIADDLIGAEARDSKTVMETAKSWVNNLESYLITPKTDFIDFVGTRWGFDDIYKHIMEKYEDDLKVYHRAVFEKNNKGERYYIFPEQFDDKSVARLKKDPKVWTAQYLNNPAEGATNFETAWKRFFEWGPGRQVVGFTGSERFSYDLRQLDKVLFIDPAINGNAGIVLTGGDDKGRIFTLYAEKKVWRPGELIEHIFSLVMKWNPRLVVIERVLFSEVFEAWLSREQRIRGIRFRIEGAPTKNKEKSERINGLAPYLQASQLYYHMSQQDLIDEHDQFGASNDIHILDALAYGPRYWRMGVNSAQLSRNVAAVNSIMHSRDATTGY